MVHVVASQVVQLQADRKKKELKVKLQMAKFLQSTVEEMAVTGRRNKKEAVQEFARFFEKVCGLVLWLQQSLQTPCPDQGQWAASLHQ